jgi:methionyl-tRNA formyltransferase
MIREPLLSDYLMLNVHGSLLPQFRGAAPVERSIMNGDLQTGVGIMQMEAGLDTGPVALEGVVPIGPDSTGGEIFAELEAQGVKLLLEALALHDSGQLTFTPQDDSQATYAHKITAEDRSLDPLAMDAQAVHNYVRALCPHIGAWVGIDGARVTLWRTSVVGDDVVGATLKPGELRVDAGRLYLGCSAGNVEILELQPSGKKRMDAGAWVRGLREIPMQVTNP